LVIFHRKKKKTRIFVTLFRPRKWSIAQKIKQAIPNDQNVGENIFDDILIRIGGRNPKCYALHNL
jgi:hypothetical protein